MTYSRIEDIRHSSLRILMRINLWKFVNHFGDQPSCCEFEGSAKKGGFSWSWAILDDHSLMNIRRRIWKKSNYASQEMISHTKQWIWSHLWSLEVRITLLETGKKFMRRYWYITESVRNHVRRSVINDKSITDSQ